MDNSHHKDSGTNAAASKGAGGGSAVKLVQKRTSTAYATHEIVTSQGKLITPVIPQSKLNQASASLKLKSPSQSKASETYALFVHKRSGSQVLIEPNQHATVAAGSSLEHQAVAAREQPHVRHNTLSPLGNQRQSLANGVGADQEETLTVPPSLRTQKKCLSSNVNLTQLTSQDSKALLSAIQQTPKVRSPSNLEFATNKQGLSNHETRLQLAEQQSDLAGGPVGNTFANTTPKQQSKQSVQLQQQQQLQQQHQAAFTELNLVEVSVLFNAKKDDMSPKNAIQAQRKAIFPNLGPRHRDQSASQTAVEVYNQSQALSKRENDQFQDRKYSSTAQKTHQPQPHTEAQQLSLVRGLQHQQSELSSTKLMEDKQPVSPQKQEAQKVGKFSYRKSSHAQPVRDNSKFRSISTQQAHGKKGYKERSSQQQQSKVQSYGQLPKLVTATALSTQQNSIMKSREEGLNNLASKLGSSVSHSNLHNQAAQQAAAKQKDDKSPLATKSAQKTQAFHPDQFTLGQAVDVRNGDFHQWFKTPSFQMQGKALLDQQQIKQISLEALQKIRAQAVLAPSQVTGVANTNQFHPQSLQQHNKYIKPGPMIGQSVLANKGSRNVGSMSKQNSQTFAQKGGSKATSPSGGQANNQHGSTHKERKGVLNSNSGTNFSSVIQSQQVQVKGRSDNKPPVVPSSSTTSRRQSEAGSRLQQRRGESSSCSKRNGVKNNSSGAPQMKQEEQIKSTTITENQKASQNQEQQLIGHKGPQDQESMNYADQRLRGDQVGPGLQSKSQLASPSINPVDGDYMGAAGESSGGDPSPTQPPKRDSAKLNNGRGASKPLKKLSLDRTHNRQFSQNQRHNRGSLAGGTSKTRQIATSKDGKGDNGRHLNGPIMNSPLMQPPPQILQSKIIINLLRTEYPLIEEVAKKEMDWRVTKSDNPNSEFDVYWNDLGIDSERLASLKPYQKANHFPAMYQITRKTYLAKNLKRLQKLYPLEFDFFPKTWVLPNELNELRNFASAKFKKTKKSPKKMLTTQLPPSTADKSKTIDLGTTLSSPTGADGPKLSKINTQQISEKKPQTSGMPESQVAATASEIARNGYALTSNAASTVTKKDKKMPSTVTLPRTSGTGADKATIEESSEGEGDEDDRDSEEESTEEADGKDEKGQGSGQNAMMGNLTNNPRRTVQRELRKAPLACKFNKKTRFPMIVKPDCSSQGKGIFLTNDIDSIPKDDTYVVQQYMQNPYLMDGLKFDLRLYVLVLSCEPLKIFLYEEGLVRFATHKYKPLDPNADKAALGNLFMHLTNYAVNKENANFKMAKGMNDDTSHKRTLKKVLGRLRADGLDTDKIMGEVKDVIIKTMITIQHDLAHNYRTCQSADLESLMCFEILGFDIILDDKGKPILLEVNQAPSFATDSPLDYEIKKGLFVDTFRLLGLSVDKKKAKVRRLYEEKKDRMLTKLTLKQKNLQRRQAINEFKKEQEAFEAANHGRFEKIYPLPTKEAAEVNTQAQNNDTLSSSQKQLAQSSYQALVRQQERYHQLLATLTNTDIEKAIRAKNRQEDQKTKDEKSKETKLKLKKTEKKRIESQIALAKSGLTNKSQLKNITDPTQNGTSLSAAADDMGKPEEQIEQAMRSSLMRPPGLEHQSHSMDERLRQSFSGRGRADQSQIVNQAQFQQYELAVQQHHHGAQASGSGLHQALALKQYQLQQSQLHDTRQASMRESINGLNLDQNQQLKQLIEIQQKIAAGVNNKTTAFNLVNLGLTTAPQTNVALTGRAASNKKQTMSGADYTNNQGMANSGGVGGNGAVQLHYATTNGGGVSQSQNPLALNQPHHHQHFKSGEYEAQMMNRTQGQSSTKSTAQGQHHHRQGNLLPNIARQKIPSEKGSTGFSHGSSTAAPGAQTPSQAGIVIQSQDYSRGKHKMHGTPYRGGVMYLHTGENPINQTPGQVAMLAAQQQNSRLIASPKKHPQFMSSQERSSLQRSSIQQSAQGGSGKPLSLKTQQVNLGAMSIQPVIIDSNHFNYVDPAKGGAGGGVGVPLTPAKQGGLISQIPIGGGSSYKTQKFSKIQLQTIIDNLYQVEAKNGPQAPPDPATQSRTSQAKHQQNQALRVVPASPKGFSRTQPYKSSQGQHEVSTVGPSGGGTTHPSMLPVVSSNDNIKRQGNLANLALNAIAKQKVQSKQPSVLGSPPGSRGGVQQWSEPAGQRLNSQGRQLISSESSHKHHQQQQVSGEAKYATHRNVIQTTGAVLNQEMQGGSPSRKLPMSPQKKLLNQSGGFIVKGSSYVGQEMRQIRASQASVPSQQHNHQQSSTSSPPANVINFNNCNVTIINNAASEGQPGSQTIIQGGLISKLPQQQTPQTPSSPSKTKPSLALHPSHLAQMQAATNTATATATGDQTQSKGGETN